MIDIDRILCPDLFDISAMESSREFILTGIDNLNEAYGRGFYIGCIQMLMKHNLIKDVEIIERGIGVGDIKDS